ncbi:Teichuronic acid biosynthesis protein TuaB [Halomicronema hongdechloris C2206]|uniref:Teichuronic acid biosynthesis protein TuaB n=1 Tax=Halomicronema hongdechloris C2206 TaxID=1641165 RepID=A0A1Z3HQB5_9CYAN|nr:lipopolysaccharide biosynthesis protein [Halomicronema hongdechloris]ASC72504.1 Teichuronic acid biosynthesis protein TuaB [Halomicronema hongdechloris C2206]
MNFKAQVIKGAIWSLIQGWGTQFGSLAVFFLLARLLTPEAFGLVALANVFLAFMQVFLSQGFADAIVQKEGLKSEHLDAAFWTSLALGSALMVIGLATSTQIANLFQKPQLASVLSWFSIILLINSLCSVHQAQLQRQFAFRALALRHLVGIVGGGIIGIIMALNGLGVWALVGQQFTQELVGVIVLWNAVDWKPKLNFSVEHWQELLNFGLNQLGFGLLGFINNRADDFLIGFYLGPTSLGYYSLAYRILSAMTNLLINSSNQVALPTFSRLQNNLERCRIAFCSATKLSSALAFPTFCCIALLSPEFITLLFGEQWLPSVPVLQVLSIVGALRSVTYFKSSVFLAMGKPSWKLRLGVVSSTLNIVGFFVAVRWGIVAVSIAYLVRACIMFPISQLAVSKLISVSFNKYLKQFIPSVVSTLVMIFCMTLISNLTEDLSNLAIKILCVSSAGLTAYILALYCFEPKFFERIRGIGMLLLKRVQQEQN